MSESNGSEKLDTWAIIELFGHGKTAGRVKTVDLCGAGMLRVDVPRKNPDGTIETDRTEYYHPNAVYALKPVSEQLATSTAEHVSTPVSTYELTTIFDRMSDAQLECFKTDLEERRARRSLPAVSPMPYRELEDEDDADYELQEQGYSEGDDA
jgi:hypothetical protein